jgi:hypothetical protein
MHSKKRSMRYWGVQAVGATIAPRSSGNEIALNDGLKEWAGLHVISFLPPADCQAAVRALSSALGLCRLSNFTLAE